MPSNHKSACLLPLPHATVEARFLRRVKRFSVEAEREGQSIWAHCNNSGAMLGLLRKGATLLLSHSPNPRRKLPYTLERVRLNGFWAGVNTSLPNRMLKAAFYAGLLDFAKNYTQFRSEAAIGRSRLDALLTGYGQPPLWVECKSVTLVEEDTAYFPDAASQRGQRHLLELMKIAAGGCRAAMFYLAQRPDGHCFAPADFIDPAYADLFGKALNAGVEIYAYQAELRDDGASLGKMLPLAPSFKAL